MERLFYLLSREDVRTVDCDWYMRAGFEHLSIDIIIYDVIIYFVQVISMYKSVHCFNYITSLAKNM